jgi:hypothetical protein
MTQLVKTGVPPPRMPMPQPRLPVVLPKMRQLLTVGEVPLQ